MSRKRLSKKQLKRDKFVEQTFDWVHWAETHRPQVIAAAIGLVVTVVAFFVYRSMSAGAEERAALAYLEARQSYFAGNYPLAASDLRQFIQRDGDTDFGDDARFFLADALYEAGQTQEAVGALEDFLSRHGDSPFAPNARLLLAAAHQSEGRLDRAVEVYEEALADVDESYRRVQIHEALAQVYELQRRPEAAAEQYRAILELDPEGSTGAEARRELAELTVRPLGVVAAPSAGDTVATEPEPRRNRK